MPDEDEAMNYTDINVGQMCHRMTNGFVKIWTHDSIDKNQCDITRKIDTITEVTHYKFEEVWIARILTNDVIQMFRLSFDERWKAERLCHELTLLVTGSDIVSDALTRNQKILDAELRC